MMIMLIGKGEDEGRSAKLGVETRPFGSEPPHYQRCVRLLHIPGTHQHSIQHRNGVDGLAVKLLSD